MRLHYLDSECKDLETWCDYGVKCYYEDVQKKCPKMCGTCEGKRCHIRHSIKTLAKPKFIPCLHMFNSLFVEIMSIKDDQSIIHERTILI